MILHTMCSGNNLEVLGILPFGMLCLSASRIILVKILLAVCMSSGMVVCEKANSYYLSTTSLFFIDQFTEYSSSDRHFGIYLKKSKLL